MTTRKSLEDDIRLCKEQMKQHKGTKLEAVWREEMNRSVAKLRGMK